MYLTATMESIVDIAIMNKFYDDLYSRLIKSHNIKEKRKDHLNMI